jgi:hypothetical protein
MEVLGVLATVALVGVAVVAVGVIIAILIAFANGFNH